MLVEAIFMMAENTISIFIQKLRALRSTTFLMENTSKQGFQNIILIFNLGVSIRKKSHASIFLLLRC